MKLFTNMDQIPWTFNFISDLKSVYLLDIFLII